MMKAADAIKAMQRMLRPGRYVAFLKPSLATAHQPLPRIKVLAFAPSQPYSKHNGAASDMAPPPKKPSVFPIRFNEAAMTSAAPPAAKAIDSSRGETSERPRPVAADSLFIAASTLPLSRLRGDECLRLLSVKT